MGEIKSLEHLNLVAAFLVPGLVALWIRAQFLHGRVVVSKDTMLTFVALSLVWYGISAPFMTWVGDLGSSPYIRSGAWFFWTVLGPALFGALLGLNASKGWTRSILRLLRIRVVHPQPTAWDWKFQDMTKAEWVILVLKDGTQFGGWCGEGSFVSSDPRERDLYVPHAYRIADSGAWESLGGGLLIAAGEIRSIEFMPEQKGCHHG
ncbi:DUF6338 family protein [Roseomonas sp. OT10]|uniref:DUF6338 family protein n=1 Tax=Roseomonas cutis TaxID=2897332 RepID=UPI001E647359|nr:DUF6338 family protein [Roseomonas sp. OT10]UFN49332.1 DUF6338 family protein [Roseomonas sp. OT10]